MQKSPQESITETAAAPADGTLLPLSEVPDNVFAAGTLGKGVAVEPTDGKFYAPFNGTVGTGTGGHAVCLVSDGGVELLIHIGIDTVNLKGKHFAIKVKEGDKVKAGDLLAEVDVAAVRAGATRPPPRSLLPTAMIIWMCLQQPRAAVSATVTNC